jgi:SnoaL-like domain
MTNAGAVITRYIELVGAHDLAPLEELFADNLVATTGGRTFDKAEWIAALDRLLPALVRNDIRQVFVDGRSACVIYDFVTDTEAGAVPCVEWITTDEAGRMTAVELIFEKANWAHVVAALLERASAR